MTPEDQLLGLITTQFADELVTDLISASSDLALERVKECDLGKPSNVEEAEQDLELASDKLLKVLYLLIESRQE